jgi:hypothetical protein
MSLTMNSALAFVFQDVHVLDDFIRLLPSAQIQHLQFRARNIKGLGGFEGIRLSSLAMFSSLKSIVLTPDTAVEELKDNITLLVAGAFPSRHRDISIKYMGFNPMT